MPDMYNYDSQSCAVVAFMVLVFILIGVAKCCIDSNKEKYKFPKPPTPQVTIEEILAVPSPHEILLSTSGASVVVLPYPVEARHPTPENKSVPAPGPGFATYSPPYPTHNPHPVPGISPASYPPAGPTPYPPAGPPKSVPYPSYLDHDSQPPSYSEAVGQPSAQPLIPKEGYTKQAPYNPNY